MIDPFKFGVYRFLEGSENNSTEDINDLRLDDMKHIMEIKDQEFTYEEVLLDKNKIPANWYSTPHGAEKIINDKKQILKKIKRKRFWRLIIFYLYGPEGSEKTGLVQELFCNELYDKPKKQCLNSNW